MNETGYPVPWATLFFLGCLSARASIAAACAVGERSDAERAHRVRSQAKSRDSRTRAGILLLLCGLAGERARRGPHARRSAGAVRVCT